MNEQKQTAKLIAVMAENLPEMTAEQRQRWIGDPKGLQNFLSGLNEKQWTEQDGVIYFTVVSNGKTGEEWITYLNGKGLPVGSYAQSVLRHKKFKPTKTGTIHQIGVISGKLFSNNDRTTKNFRDDAKKRKMTDPHAEVACLIRDMFSDKEIKEMGLDWIITMHEPIPDSYGNLCLLGTARYDDYMLHAFYSNPGNRWHRENGFAFVQGPQP